jgi:two-component system response regulator AtoC
MKVLIEHSWPGNIRELENVVERAIVLADGDHIELKHLPPTVRGTVKAPGTKADDLSVKRQSATLEKSLIEQALERTSGNRTRAAELLDLSHRALLYKIREYGLGD